MDFHALGGFAVRRIGPTISTMVVATIICVASVPPAEAFDMDCKVILCLAGGFPSGCGDAKSYMLDRIRDRKPPIGTCSTEDVEASEYSVPVRMFTRDYPRRCLNSIWVQEGQGDSGYQCRSWSVGRTDGIIGITTPDENGLDYSNEFVWYTRLHERNDK